MKKMQTKKIISVLMLIVMMALLIATCVLFMTPIKTADADGKPTTATLSLEQTSIVPGNSIVLKLTMTTVRSGICWAAFTVRVYPVTKDSGLTSGAFKSDADAAQYLSYEYDTEKFVGDNAAEFKSKYALNVGSYLDMATPYVEIGIAVNDVDKNIDASVPVEIEVPLKVSEDVLDVADRDSFSFSIRPTKTSSASYGASQATMETDYGNADIDINKVSIDVKIPSTDATLSELKMGIGDNLTAVDLTKTPITFSITGSDLSNFTILPTANDGASIKVGLTLPAATEAPSGEKTKLAITTSTTAVYIETTAEDGKTTKRYTVAIKIAYVALSDLTVTSTPVTTGVTKNGLATEFESDTLNYDVNVPEKATMTKVSATIVTGFDTNKTISLTGENCTPARGSLTSGGTEVNILQVKEGSVLKLTLTAPDGTTKRVYTLTFHKLSENTGIDSIKVKGATSNTEYANDADKAKDENVDYYFVLDNEPDEEPKGIFAITTAEEKATIKIGETEYSATAQFAMGTYDVIITAAAGNTHTYKVVLSGLSVLEFAENSNFKFIFEEVVIEDDEPYYYRRTYEEKNMVHGKDDKDFERLVIGCILPNMTIRDFLANFADSQQGSIKLYDIENNLITDRGNPGPGITEDELSDPEFYTVGTGWYIEYGKGETPSETVYISVLGDITGDGLVQNADIVQYNLYKKRRVTWTLEQRLASYVTNVTGDVDPSDAVKLGLFMKRRLDLADYL